MVTESKVKKVNARVLCARVFGEQGKVTQSRDDPSSDRDRTGCHGNPPSHDLPDQLELAQNESREKTDRLTGGEEERGGQTKSVGRSAAKSSDTGIVMNKRDEVNKSLRRQELFFVRLPDTLGEASAATQAHTHSSHR